MIVKVLLPFISRQKFKLPMYNGIPFIRQRANLILKPNFLILFLLLRIDLAVIS